MDSRIVEGELDDVVLPMVTPYLIKSSLMSPPLGDQTKRDDITTREQVVAGLYDENRSYRYG